jgi:hypothetical protein
MPFTVEEFHDLIRLLEARPEWRVELRRFVLTDELLALPEQVAEVRLRSEQQFQALLEAQQRLEARVTALAEAQQRTGALVESLTARVESLTARVESLTARVESLTTQVTALAEAQSRTERTVQSLVNDVGELKGKSLEADYRARGHAYFSRLIRRPHVLTSDELMTLIEDARDSGVFSDADAQEIYDADLVVRGRRSEDGASVYLLVEVSWGIGPHDVERAAQRAALLASTGTTVFPVVAGKRVTPRAAQLAQRRQVWQLTNGRAIPPDPVLPSG